MELRLDGKVALVTGASKGIGRAVAATYAAAGAKVMLSSRKQDALDEAAAGMVGETSTFAANAGEPDQARACVDATLERFGRIDVLVNNAAANPYHGPILGISESAAEKTVRVNQTGYLIWTQLVWESWMRDNGGVVLNMASIGGMRAGEAIGWYNVTKAAVIHLTTQLAREMAPGVRVNALAPGLVKTDFAKALWQPAEEAIAKRTPLRRLGEPQDIANAALFLASDAASWITGQTLAIDGGALLAAAV